MPIKLDRAERRRIAQRKADAAKRAKKQEVAKAAPKVTSMGSLRKYTIRIDPDQPVDMSRAKITICPSGHDTRFLPTDAQPYFSAMGVGRYMA